MAGVRLMFVMVLLCGALAARGAEAQTVLFDNGHGERFLIGEKGALHLSGLVELFQAAGARVATLDQPISDATLAGADALVISGAFAPLTPEEIAAVDRFMKRGGKLAVMLHTAPPLATLLDHLKVGYTNGVIRERENMIEDDPQRFRVTRLGAHPVTQGLQEFNLYGVWGLINRDDSARIVAATSPHAWIDLNRDKVQKKETTASFGVVVAGEVGKGGFLVFGDDAIFQNKFLEQNNKVLAANLAGWLK
ncbi:MAG: ABC transporter [Geobacteraceae bacterium GWC2_58_44]|nr:MAG: ABC transporter [Geobacteraceae bacterium GWC2_58_44]HBG04692.1 DUF4350 domain-containing protein [Geobacter sp.]